MTSKELSKAYNPKEVEGPLYQSWMDKGYFAPKIPPRSEWKKKPPFVIIMPPPNVTGELHLGHALTASLQDIMTRWHRMKGDSSLWLPGFDHAGIATQVVVERELAKEGKTRQDLGREKFIERVWEWVHHYGGVIREQHKRLGASCDWSRDTFTMDPGPSLAVRTTFVNLYKKGLIYQGERIINWCPRCATALSDLEVVYQEEAGHLWHIKYKQEKGKGFVTVATTRPETLLGDTAVAVNPDDKRYKRLIGKNVVVPSVNRTIPIVADDAVETAFGTGAVKVTPAHDPVDFDIAQRHNLPFISVIGLDGKMTAEAGSTYAGMDSLECREKLVAELQQQGILEKVEPYSHSVGHCQRCRTIVEPLVSKQWFVKIAPLAEPAKRAVEDGRIKIIPDRFTKVYLNWMEGIRDWCISRQLWWGHRIPVWYCNKCQALTVAVEDPKACSKCGSPDIYQDPDVLDTWFSSGLWPHSTLGWPKKSEALDYFYPTAVMETAYDILFFWVARMIMMGIENMGEVPFRTVYLHGLIRDASGEKMSKTRGNVINPLEAIEQYGTDALRFALTSGNTPGNDMRLSPERLEAGRNFANKIWNASRFVMGIIAESAGADYSSLPARSALHPEGRWILSRLNRVIQKVDGLMNDFEFGEAEREIYDFLWGEFCDWYIEMAKVRMRSDAAGKETSARVLAHTLETCLRLLHPFMPFVTEEIWQRLPRRASGPASIMIAPYPVVDASYLDDAVEAEFALVNEIVRHVRNVRAEDKIELGKTVQVSLYSDAATLRKLEGSYKEFIAALAKAALAFQPDTAPRPQQSRMAAVGNVEVHVLPPALSQQEAEAERKRLAKSVEEYLGRINGRKQRLAPDGAFATKAPAQVLERERQRLREEEEELGRIQERLSKLGS